MPYLFRQVWKIKSEHGERVSSTVAYGCKKSEDDPKKWVIDEPAAIVVKKNYGLCLNGKGPQQIIPNMHEPIIFEEQWLQVQKIRKNRIRPTATGRTGLFAGKVFCADCGSKLHFCAAKSLRPDQEFYRCANYKNGRGKYRGGAF
ncbi:MAG: recombinase zinc beta ribbon domain-containing protein [Lachnospiraceae bacterium]|nr:recombinase zinc beta ribbon domain-containing protein [Lachnospiraceae bacterium]